MGLEDILALAPVVPVIKIDDCDDALPLARALVTGGLPVLEVTLRTPDAIDAISRIAKEIEGVIVGAGTVTTLRDCERVSEAGARFVVSAGLVDELLTQNTLPYLPGVATASEILRGLAAGKQLFKFFPALPAGGVGALDSFKGPFPDARFCPTGGIDFSNFRTFLELDNVICVGGSWLSPQDVIRKKDWATIRGLARQARGLG